MKPREEIVEEVIGWFHNEAEQSKMAFLETKAPDLILYHHTLGRKIRNEFGLWEAKWTPELQDGVDCSGGHPDALSQSIIEEVYFKLKELHKV
jgi:hypothetical protein